MEKFSHTKRFRLLPNYFKWWGLLSIIASPLILILGLKLFRADFIDLIGYDFLIIGLFIVAISRERIEDELIQMVRLRAIAFSFIATIVYVIIDPLFSLLFDSPLYSLKAQGVITGMILGYLVYFYFLKRRR